MPKQSAKSRGHVKRISTVPQPCGKQWQSCALQAWGTETVPVRGAAGGAAGGAARDAAGTVPEQRGAGRPAARVNPNPNTNKAGTGPPRCLDNCANNSKSACVFFTYEKG